MPLITCDRCGFDEYKSEPGTCARCGAPTTLSEDVAPGTPDLVVSAPPPEELPPAARFAGAFCLANGLATIAILSTGAPGLVDAEFGKLVGTVVVDLGVGWALVLGFGGYGRGRSHAVSWED